MSGVVLILYLPLGPFAGLVAQKMFQRYAEKVTEKIALIGRISN